MLAPAIETSPSKTTECGSDLGALVVQLKEELAVLKAQSQQRIEELEKTNRLLREQVDAVLRRFFGSRTKDSIDPAQLELVMKGLESPETPSTPATPPLTSRGSNPKGKANDVRFQISFQPRRS